MSDYKHDRHFTIEEADTMIPKLAAILMKVQDALENLSDQRQTALEAIREARGNGKPQSAPESDALVRLRELTEEIEALGCLLKDYEHGIVDFPSLRQGEEVYLCWKLGEPSVSHWHEIDEGYAGRRDL